MNTFKRKQKFNQIIDLWYNEKLASFDEKLISNRKKDACFLNNIFMETGVGLFNSLWNICENIKNDNQKYWWKWVDVQGSHTLECKTCHGTAEYIPSIDLKKIKHKEDCVYALVLNKIKINNPEYFI